MTSLFFGFFLPIIALVIVAVVAIGHDVKDKEYRQQNNLPPRKYHNAVDYDIHKVYTIHYGNDRRD